MLFRDFLTGVRVMGEGAKASQKTSSRIPRLIAFDMDFTLWPFHADTHPYPPLRLDQDGKIKDKRNTVFEPFPGVSAMLQNLHEEGYTMAVVSRCGFFCSSSTWSCIIFSVGRCSDRCHLGQEGFVASRLDAVSRVGGEQIRVRTEAPPVGRDMLKYLDWLKYFKHQEIYPGRKTTHFKKIKEESGIEYCDMLFFDDEYRNIRDMSAVGVVCFYLEEPMSRSILEKGLDMFSKGVSHK